VQSYQQEVTEQGISIPIFFHITGNKLGGMALRTASVMLWPVALGTHACILCFFCHSAVYAYACLLFLLHGGAVMG
jgi:hypothetical protein